MRGDNRNNYMEEYECKNKAMPLHAKRRPKESEGGSEIGRKKEREGERDKSPKP